MVSSRFPHTFPALAKSFLKIGVRFRTRKTGNFLEYTRSPPAWNRFPTQETVLPKSFLGFPPGFLSGFFTDASMLPQCPTCQALTNPTWQTCPVCQQPLNSVLGTAARSSKDILITDQVQPLLQPAVSCPLFTHGEDLEPHTSSWCCPCCKGTWRWRSIYGAVVCARCHPPADMALVAWEGEDMDKTIETQEGAR
jgi:hypothetical protein